MDLTPGSGNAANRVFALPHPEASLDALLVKFTGTGTPTNDDAFELLSALRRAADTKALESRWITARGDVVTIYVVYDTATQNLPTVQIKEEPRKTQIETDLATLAKVVSKIAGMGFAAGDLKATSLRAYRTEYVLTKPRAIVTLNAAAEPASGSTVGKITADASLTVGPTEHLYLSVDLPVTSVSTLKYDSTGHEIGPSQDPSVFYLGVDLLLGDLLTVNRSFWGNFSLKGLLKISKNPLDSYGGAIGYRLPPIKTFGFELDSFSPFVGYIWIRTPAGTTTKTQGHPRAGLSFNLDKALNWVK